MGKRLLGIFDRFHKQIQKVYESDIPTEELRVYGQTESDNNEIGSVVQDMGLDALWSQQEQAWIFRVEKRSDLERLSDELNNEFDIIGITASIEITNEETS